jgi:membrane protease YdiL (CAAX protease family)
MNGSPGRSSGVARWGVAVELGLAVVALAVGALVGYSPLQTIELSWRALPDHLGAMLWGAAATLPMVPVLLLVEKAPLRPLRRLRNLVRRWIAPYFAGESVGGLALISASAGVGEEMLFRGLIQAGVAAWIGGSCGVWVGLATGSLAFGLAHSISLTYVILATLIGAYLGWVFWASGHLLAPIVAHGLYDFLALFYFVRCGHARRPARGPE